jgi:hypothetical protein
LPQTDTLVSKNLPPALKCEDQHAYQSERIQNQPEHVLIRPQAEGLCDHLEATNEEEEAPEQ